MFKSQNTYSFVVGDFSFGYKLLDNHPEILFPVAAAASGYIAAGGVGALLGFSLVGAERLYNYYYNDNVTLVSTSFLSYSIFSTSLKDYTLSYKHIIMPLSAIISGYFIDHGFLENNSKIVDFAAVSLMGANICGVPCGVMAFAGALADCYVRNQANKELIDYQDIATCTDDHQNDEKYVNFAITGAFLCGLPCARAGMSAVAIESHFLHGSDGGNSQLFTVSTSLYSMLSTTNHLLGSDLSKYYKYTILAAVPLLSYLHEIYGLGVLNIRYSEQIDHYYKVKNSFSEMLGKENAQNQLYSHVVINSGINLAGLYFFNNVIKDYNSMRRSISSEGIDVNIFKKSVKSFIQQLLIYMSTHPVQSYVNKFFVNKAHIDIRQTKQEMWLHGSSPIAIENMGLNHTEVQSLNERFNRNSWDFCQNGIEENVQIISNFQEFIYVLTKLSSEGNQHLVITSLLLHSVMNYMTSFLGGYVGEYSVEIKRLANKEETLSKQVSQNARQIVETGGADFTKAQLNQASYERLEVEIKKDNLISILQFWKRIKSWMAHVGVYAASVALAAEDKGLIKFVDGSSYQASHLSIFSWSDDNAHKLKSLSDAMGSMQKLMDLLRRAQDINESELRREFYENSDSMKINMSVSVTGESQTIVDFNDVTLNVGKIYSFTGPSGSGKSSSISKIIGVDGNGITAEGVIEYPCADRDEVLYAPQKDYVPYDVSLCQAIIYPELEQEGSNCNGRESEIAKKLDFLRFFTDVNISEYKIILYEKKDWNKVLSGGQLKKLSLVRALIKSSKVLILDEMFNGMDPESIVSSQNLIEAFGVGKIIIIVDHNADSNNQEGFYSGGNINIWDKRIFVNDSEKAICKDIFDSSVNDTCPIIGEYPLFE